MATLVPAPAALTDHDIGSSSKGVFGTFKSRFLGGSSRSVNSISPHRSGLPPSSHKSKSPSIDSNAGLSSKSSGSLSSASHVGRSPPSSTYGRQASNANAKPKSASKQSSTSSTARMSTYSTTSQGSNKSQGNRAPSPTLMYASFGFEGPIKKPRPLPLDPAKMRRKPMYGKPKQASVGSPVRSGEWRLSDTQVRRGSTDSSPSSVGASSHHASTIASSPQTLPSSLQDDASSFSEISSFRAGSPTDTVNLPWNLKPEVDSPRFSPCMGSDDVSPVSPTEPQYLDMPDVSNESGPETPSATELEFARNRNMRKLARMLGENVTDLIVGGEDRVRESMKEKGNQDEIQEILREEWVDLSAAELPASKSLKDVAEPTERRARAPGARVIRPEFVYSITHAEDAAGGVEGRWVTVGTSFFSKSQEDVAQSPNPRLTNVLAGITVKIPGKEPDRFSRLKRRPSTAEASIASPTSSCFSNGSDRTQQGRIPDSASAASTGSTVDSYSPQTWLERTLRRPPPRSASLNRRPVTAGSPSSVIDISHDFVQEKEASTKLIMQALSPSKSVMDMRRDNKSQDWCGSPEIVEPPPLRIFERDPNEKPARPPRRNVHQRSSTSSGLTSPTQEADQALSSITNKDDRDLSTLKTSRRRSISLHKTHASEELPHSPRPFEVNTDYLAPPSPSGGLKRKERKEGWSGEWNQSDMQDVIRKLRELK